MKAELRLVLSLFTLLSAGGCASMGLAPSPGREQESEAKRALSLYVDCLYIHADALAGGTGAPPEIAGRALAHCESRFARYCAAATDYFTAVAGPADKSLAIERAQASCSKTRDESRQTLAARVVDERERLSQRLAAAANLANDGKPDRPAPE